MKLYFGQRLIPQSLIIKIKLKSMKRVKLQPNHKPQEGLSDQYPNEATISDVRENPMNPDNHFQHTDVEVIRKKYLQFTVYMEALQDVLELDRFATIDQFAHRVRDIVLATNKQ